MHSHVMFTCRLLKYDEPLSMIGYTDFNICLARSQYLIKIHFSEYSETVQNVIQKIRGS